MTDHEKLMTQMDESFPGWERHFCSPDSLADVATAKDEHVRQRELASARQFACYHIMNVVRAALYAGIVKLPD